MENFDKKIKEKINRYNSTVDPNEIWDGIQRKRKKDKKKIIIPLFRIAAIVILLIGFAVIFNLEDIFYNNGINKESAKSSNIKILKNNLTRQIDKSENLAASELNSKKSISNNLHGSILQKNKNNNISSTTHKYLSDFYGSKSDLLDHKTVKINDSGFQNSIIELVNTKSNLKDQNGFTTNENFIIKLDIPLNQISRLQTNLKLTPQIFAALEKKKPIGKFNEISFDLTPQYALRQIIAKDENFKMYADNVRNHEKFLESFDVKFYFKKSIYKNFYFGSGLIYSQIDRKLDFAYKTSETYEDNNVLSRMVFNMPGDTIRYYSSKMVTANYEIKEKIYNYKRKIHLPILIGYFGNLGKLNFDISTGLNFILLDFSKGRIITPEGKTIDIKDDNINLLNKSILNNINFSINLRKRFSKNLYMNFGPEFKFGFNSYNRSSGIKVIENSVGINLGLNYKF